MLEIYANKFTLHADDVVFGAENVAITPAWAIIMPDGSFADIPAGGHQENPGAAVDSSSDGMTVTVTKVAVDAAFTIRHIAHVQVPVSAKSPAVIEKTYIFREHPVINVPVPTPAEPVLMAGVSDPVVG